MTCPFCGGETTGDMLHALVCDGRQGAVEAAADGDRYPMAAGWQRTDTSREAAESTDAATVRAEVERWFRRHGPHTADEAAAGLNLSVLTVRPRCTELRALGHLVDTGRRGLNVSGKRAIIWRVVGVREGQKRESA